MIAPVHPIKPSEPHPDLMLVISIDRPSPENPHGFMCLTAHRKTGSKEEPLIDFEDGPDGAIDSKTEEAIIADIRSYIAKGRKSLVNETKKDQGKGRSF
jgi:hypothetical protein